jgi:hypothetical protein
MSWILSNVVSFVPSSILSTSSKLMILPKLIVLSTLMTSATFMKTRRCKCFRTYQLSWNPSNVDIKSYINIIDVIDIDDIIETDDVLNIDDVYEPHKCLGTLQMFWKLLFWNPANVLESDQKLSVYQYFIKTNQLRKKRGQYSTIGLKELVTQKRMRK